IVGDDHALAMALGERRRPFLAPGLDLGPGRIGQQADRRGSRHSGEETRDDPVRTEPPGRPAVWHGDPRCLRFPPGPVRLGPHGPDVRGPRAPSAHRYNDTDSPASLTTVKRSVWNPSTTHGVVTARVRSERIAAGGTSRFEANTDRTLPGRFGNACPCTESPRSGAGPWT